MFCEVVLKPLGWSFMGEGKNLKFPKKTISLSHVYLSYFKTSTIWVSLILIKKLFPGSLYCIYIIYLLSILTYIFWFFFFRRNLRRLVHAMILKRPPHEWIGAFRFLFCFLCIFTKKFREIAISRNFVFKKLFCMCFSCSYNV